MCKDVDDSSFHISSSSNSLTCAIKMREFGELLFFLFVRCSKKFNEVGYFSLFWAFKIFSSLMIGSLILGIYISNDHFLMYSIFYISWNIVPANWLSQFDHALSVIERDQGLLFEVRKMLLRTLFRMSINEYLTIECTLINISDQ